MTTLETDGFLSDEAATAIADYRARFKDLFSVAETTNQFALKILRSPKIENAEEWQVISCLLTIRIVEAFEGTILLIERGMVAPATLMLRPILEALFVLGALQSDNSLVRAYHDAQARADRKKLYAAMQWRNDALKQLSKKANLEKKYIEIKQAHKQTPPVEMTPIDWAKKAGLEDFYHTYYVFYASRTHSNREALDDHIDQSDHGADQIDLAFGPKVDGIYDVIRNASAFCLMAIMYLGEAFECDTQEGSKEIFEAIQEIDRTYNAL